MKLTKNLSTIYHTNTEAAKRMGIFGVPSFTVENEIFGVAIV